MRARVIRLDCEENDFGPFDLNFFLNKKFNYSNSFKHSKALYQRFFLIIIIIIIIIISSLL